MGDRGKASEYWRGRRASGSHTEGLCRRAMDLVKSTLELVTNNMRCEACQGSTWHLGWKRVDVVVETAAPNWLLARAWSGEQASSFVNHLSHITRLLQHERSPTHPPGYLQHLLSAFFLVFSGINVRIDGAVAFAPTSSYPPLDLQLAHELAACSSPYLAAPRLHFVLYLLFPRHTTSQQDGVPRHIPRALRL